VEGQRKGVGLLRDQVLEWIAVALADPTFKGIAIFILGRRVPGLAPGQVLFSDVLEIGSTAEACRAEAGRGRPWGPLAGARVAEGVILPIDRAVFVTDLSPGDRGLKREPAGAWGLINQIAVAGQIDRHSLLRELAGHDEMGILEAGVQRLRQDILGARRA